MSIIYQLYSRTERYYEKFHTFLNGAVYYMVFPRKLKIYYYFKSRFDSQKYLNKLEIISKLYNFLDHS